MMRIGSSQNPAVLIIERVLTFQYLPGLTNYAIFATKFLKVKKETRVLIITCLFFLAVIAGIVIRYERLLKGLRTEGADTVKTEEKNAPKTLTPAEIIEKIKVAPEYIGDSIFIFEDGSISSSNTKFQGTLNAVINSQENMNIVKSNGSINRLPDLYNIYILAAVYYRRSYPDEFKK